MLVTGREITANNIEHCFSSGTQLYFVIRSARLMNQSPGSDSEDLTSSTEDIIYEQNLSEQDDDEESAQSQHKEKIKALRSRIKEDRNNNFAHLERNDDAFLLLFLQARYFRVPASYQLLCNYKEFRAKNASVFQNLSAWRLHHVIEDGFPCVLPYNNQNGAKMMVIFAGGWDTETYGSVDILKAFILSMERLIEDKDVQRNGIIIIADFSGWTTTHTSQLSVSFIRQVCCMLQVRELRIRSFIIGFFMILPLV